MVSAVLQNALMKSCDLILVTAVIVLGFSAARAQNVAFGERLFRDKADCQFCHGIDGDGRLAERLLSSKKADEICST